MSPCMDGGMENLLALNTLQLEEQRKRKRAADPLQDERDIIDA